MQYSSCTKNIIKPEKDDQTAATQANLPKPVDKPVSQGPGHSCALVYEHKERT